MGVVVLAVTLLAVLVLAGVGAAASLRAGARAERVRGLVPFAGALTTLVDELQRERSLSAARPVPGPPWRRPGTRSTAPPPPTATPPSGSRSRTGTASSTGASPTGCPARRPGGTARLGRRRQRERPGRLGHGVPQLHPGRRRCSVGTEIGLQEAGQDAGLLRVVSAASAFSRAKELADRERAAAAGAADGPDGVDPTERVRWPRLGGRQDAPRPVRRHGHRSSWPGTAGPSPPRSNGRPLRAEPP